MFCDPTFALSLIDENEANHPINEGKNKHCLKNFDFTAMCYSQNRNSKGNKRDFCHCYTVKITNLGAQLHSHRITCYHTLRKHFMKKASNEQIFGRFIFRCPIFLFSRFWHVSVEKLPTSQPYYCSSKMEIKTSDEESALNGEVSPSTRLNSFPLSSSTQSWDRDPLSIVSSIRTSQSLVFSVDQEEVQHRRSVGFSSIVSAIFLFFGGIVSAFLLCCQPLSYDPCIQLLTIIGGIYYWEHSFEAGLALFVVGLLSKKPFH